jgi:hypothetical protein
MLLAICKLMYYTLLKAGSKSGNHSKKGLAGGVEPPVRKDQLEKKRVRL